MLTLPIYRLLWHLSIYTLVSGIVCVHVSEWVHFQPLKSSPRTWARLERASCRWLILASRTLCETCCAWGQCWAFLFHPLFDPTSGAAVLGSLLLAHLSLLFQRSIRKHLWRFSHVLSSLGLSCLSAPRTACRMQESVVHRNQCATWSTKHCHHYSLFLLWSLPTSGPQHSPASSYLIVPAGVKTTLVTSSLATHRAFIIHRLLIILISCVNREIKILAFLRQTNFLAHLRHLIKSASSPVMASCFSCVTATSSGYSQQQPQAFRSSCCSSTTGRFVIYSFLVWILCVSSIHCTLYYHPW